MATEKRKLIYTVEFDADGAIKSMDKVGKEVEDVSDSLGKSEKAAKKAGTGFSNFGKKIGMALKAAGGLGLIVTAVEAIKEAFSNNQQVMDAFDLGIKSIGIAVNDFFTFVNDNVGTVVEYFKQIFEDPQTAAKNFGIAIKDNIETRITSAIEFFGLAGEAIKKFFQRDFDGAAEAAAKAGEKLLDVGTGVENTYQKVKRGAAEAVEAITEYTTSTVKAAEQIQNQEKSLAKLEVQQQKMMLQYQEEAEIQRQLRDDVTLSIDERIAANEKLGKILDEQAEEEKKNINARIAAVQAQQNALGVTEERTLELMRLETEMADLNERIRGQRSEQLTNENALLQEKKDNLEEIMLIGKEDDERAKAEALNELERQQELIERTIENEELKNERLLAARQEYESKIKEIDDSAKAEKQKADEEAAKKEEEIEKQKEDAKAALRQAGFDAARGLTDLLVEQGAISAEQAFNVNKALGIVEATINTAKAVTSALATPIVGPALAAAAGAAGAVQIATIASQKFNAASAKSGGGGSSAASAPSVSYAAPQFNIAGDDGTNQLGQAINNQTQTPVKAYVTTKDFNSTQALERNINNSSRIGG